LSQILRNRESRNIFLFLCINLFFMFVELLYGIWTNSLGLISDACHMLFDCTALAIGLAASVISKWPPSDHFSFGFGRVQVLSGFVNAIFLVLIAGSVFIESVSRLQSPPEIRSRDRLLVVSVLGLLVNLVGVFAFSDAHSHAHGHSHSHSHSHSHGGGQSHHDDKKGDNEKKKKEHDHHDHHDSHHHDHEVPEDEDEHSNDNMNGIFLHVLADTLGSVAVIISSVLIQLFGWTLADPICSFLLSILIFSSVIPLLCHSAYTLLLRTPQKILPKLSTALSKVRSIEGVTGVRDVHFWNHDGTTLFGTLHLSIQPPYSSQDTSLNRTNHQNILKQVRKIFSKHHIEPQNLTIQVELENGRNNSNHGCSNSNSLLVPNPLISV